MLQPSISVEYLLKEDFYLRPDVVTIARDLLGKVLFTNIDGQFTSGIITETEAYCGQNDKACHANNGKVTSRNKAMYLHGGHAYVYLCYGIHHLFNVVTNREGVADAVLVRSVAPLDGVEIMTARRGIPPTKPSFTAGPGTFTRALGISLQHNGMLLSGGDIGILDKGFKVSDEAIIAATRIGVDYAGEDAKRLWRFYLKDSVWVSKKLKQ